MHAGHLILPILLLSACGIAESTAAGPSGTRSFDASGFDEVELAGSDNVRVIAGSTFSVQATGPEEILERLKINVKGSRLVIGRKSQNWVAGWQNSESALVTVTMPTIKAASLAGSGDMAIDRVETAAFEANLAGSGNLSVKSAQVETLEVNIAGSGDIALAGTTKTVDISIAGSGDVSAKELTAADARISIAGSGNVDTRVTGSASISLLGSGDVTINGTANCKTSKMGSGEVRCTP
ncbi:MAG: head GIN domain-containing protein [Pseudomonadota bacterium]